MIADLTFGAVDFPSLSLRPLQSVAPPIVQRKQATPAMIEHIVSALTITQPVLQMADRPAAHRGVVDRNRTSGHHFRAMA
ncbi:hypothetical protein ABH945_003272 [Paraburkholderia sp. GAS333]|uniref:hypothetical protein n=1 Tax=Paraburkholderia sp. GAS333 TaxID=3156279 RepID=UPI003D1DB3A6